MNGTLTGGALSKVAFGTMTFGSRVDAADAQWMVDRCIDAGVTHFDTANTYNAGDSERMLARVLEGRRDKVTIATKVRHSVGEEPGSLSPEHIAQAIDASLARLDTDHVDVYYLHQPDDDVPIAETLGAMAALVDAGKIGHIGVSNYAAWQIADIHALSAQHGWPRVSIAQQMYNLISRGLDDEYASFAAAHGMTTVVYNPLAGGLLTGRYQTADQPEPGTRFSSASYRERYWNERQFAAVDALATVAADAQMSLTQLAMRWLLSRPVVDSVLVGASTREQLDENLSALDDSPLSPELLDCCDDVWQQLKGPVPRYNR